MAAAQLMAAARREVAGLDAALGRGDLSPLLAWLRAKVHGQGSLFEFNALLRRRPASRSIPPTSRRI